MASKLEHKTKVTLTIPDDLLIQARVLAVKKKISLSALAEIALRELTPQESNE